MKLISLWAINLVVCLLSFASAAYADEVALSFDPPSLPIEDANPPVLEKPPVSQQGTPPTPSRTARSSVGDRAALFSGGSDSLVARAVGHAEGTRTSDGGKTRAYYGHTDPGNGVWNRGTFSYQFGNAQNLSAEESDRQQLAKLKAHHQRLQQRANGLGVDLTLEEELNAIDLANQAPLAALGSPGYVERLKQAHQQGLRGSDAVLWARVQSYWDPQRNGWDAPGLGNTQARIEHDQNRRQQAIAETVQSYQPVKPPKQHVADTIIFQDLPRDRRR
ncbi:hypothetical protein H6F43_16475 [Leptolyngbya sp. FACHB-36]|uniref:hypothetical protein n=1 Tax=Leptolyngbya sp. FACHB-36 TaxID=2692808 RepID=UPI001681A7EE|nr:hypothetical protein [Leptolyngbya sp. FACHB-36]MBD2021777.1 hypothetical protein [Leptolyngbya sp. FACHB-36]